MIEIFTKILCRCFGIEYDKEKTILSVWEFMDKEYENDFKETNWEKTIHNMHFRPEDTKHTNLLEFSNKMFPNIKIVEKTA